MPTENPLHMGGFRVPFYRTESLKGMVKMAQYKKRGKTWEVRVETRQNGERKSISKGGFATKKEAELYGATLLQSVDEGTAFTQSDASFANYFLKWYQTYKEPVVSDRTKKTYEHAHHVLEKYFTDHPMSELTRSDYQSFLTIYGESHAKTTARKINSLYHAAVKNALYDGAIKRDFIEQTKVVYDRQRTRKIDYLSIEDLVGLTDYLEQSLNPHYPSKYMILTAIFTGMRLGEIQGLKWADINTTFKTISVKRAWQEQNKEFIPTKNESSVRTIRVPDELLDILASLPHLSDQVFVSQFESVPTSSAVNKTLKTALQEAGINRPGFHFHSLRHTHVAYLLANDVDIYAISKRLGHSDLGTTTKVYAYMIEEHQARTDEQIVGALSKLNFDAQMTHKQA